MRAWPQGAALRWPRRNISQQRDQGPELPHREGSGPPERQRQLQPPRGPLLSPPEPAEALSSPEALFSVPGGGCEGHRAFSARIWDRVATGIVRRSPLCTKQQGETKKREGAPGAGGMQSLVLTSGGLLWKAESRAIQRPHVCWVLQVWLGRPVGIWDWVVQTWD